MKKQVGKFGGQCVTRREDYDEQFFTQMHFRYVYNIYIYDFPFGSEFLRDLLSIDTMFRPPVREEPEI